MQLNGIRAGLITSLIGLSICYPGVASSDPPVQSVCQRNWVALNLSPPQKLSETGLFANLKTLEVCPGVEPYWVNSPLWSDGAEKKRWILVPQSHSIVFAEDEPWKFPNGTLFIKQFEANGSRIETRVSWFDLKGQWQGVSYRWNDDQRDATLLEGGHERDLGNGQKWTYPSRTMCTQCHNPWSGSVLGVRTEQLNQTIQQNGVVRNQLSFWDSKGYFARTIPKGNALRRYFHLHDPTVSIELRARSYLAVNCSHCHQPGSVVRSPIDLRYKTPLAETQLVNAPPYLGNLDLDDGVIVRPGDKASSILWLRMNTHSTHHMPLIGSAVTDEEAVQLVGDWITQMKAP